MPQHGYEHGGENKTVVTPTATIPCSLLPPSCTLLKAEDNTYFIPIFTVLKISNHIDTFIICLVDKASLEICWNGMILNDEQEGNFEGMTVLVIICDITPQSLWVGIGIPG